MPKIIVLCGMISSGKSSYCRNAARNGQLIVNDDSVVKMIHGDDYTLYDKKFKLLYKTLENQVVSSSLMMGHSVVIDRGLNVSLRGRQRWLALANSFDVDCEAIVFRHEGVETHARRRYDSDSRGYDYEYWLRVAGHHSSIYSAPKKEEGFAEVHLISYEEILAGKVIL